MVDKLDRFEILFAIPEVRGYLAMNSNLTSEQVQRILDDSPTEETLRGLAQYGKLTDEQFEELKLFHSSVRRSLARNPHLTSEQIDFIIEAREKGSDEYDMGDVARRPKLTDEQFNKLANLESGIYYYLSLNPNLTHGQINTLYEIEGVDRDYLAQNAKLSEAQFEQLWEGDEDSEQGDNGHHHYLSDNPHLTEDQIDRLMEHENVDEEGLATFPKLSDEQFDKLFRPTLTGYLARNPNLTPDQIDRLYSTYQENNQNHDIRLSNLIGHPALTDSQFEEFLSIWKTNDGTDPSKAPKEVIANLAMNPSINPDPKEVKDWSANTGLINWVGTTWVW